MKVLLLSDMTSETKALLASKRYYVKCILKVITLFAPPILALLYRHLKKKWGHNAFSGVFNKIDEIKNENPWIQKQWIELSNNKLVNTIKISTNAFIPASDFGGYNILPCLALNLLSQNKSCNFLDFGGGTGFTYFKIFPYLLNPDNVTYHVVDSNLELFRLGKKHAKSMGKKNRILFHAKMPKKEDIQLDILFINTSLQYIYDYSSVLATLLGYKPQYVILTRLIAGDMKTYITSQNIHGKITPCIFINFQEIVDIFSKNGFKLIFKAPCKEESFEGSYNKNIPKHLRIHNTANLIFLRID